MTKCRSKFSNSSAGRLKVVLRDMGYKHDVVEAVLAAQSNNPAGLLGR